jgi:hypothetical protein
MKLCEEKPARMLANFIHTERIKWHLHPVNRLSNLGLDFIM